MSYEDDIIRKTYKFQVKSAKDDGKFTGYASVFGNIDSDSEVVDKGAFSRSLKSNNGVVPILFGHDVSKPCGWNIKAEEDDYGLKVEGQCLMDTEMGKYAFSFIKTGLEVGGKPGLSIGFRVPKGGDSRDTNGNRHFTECQLMEYSVVVFPSNFEASASWAKGAISSDLPLTSEDRAWDAGAARSRLLSWAGGGEDKSKTNWGKFKRGFLWYDSANKEELGSYKLPIGDVINGKLMAVPHGIMAAAGGHGVNSADIPESDKTKIKSTINRYYKKMGKDSPFTDKSQGGNEMTKHSFKSSDFMDQMNLNNDLDEHYDKKWKMERALSQAINGITEDKTISKDDKKSAINDCLDDHAKCMKAWHSKYLDITQPDDEDDEESDDEKSAKALAVANFFTGKPLTAKEGRAISEATKKKLAMAAGHIKDASGHAQSAMDSHEKGLAVLRDLSVGRYFNDVNVEHPVGGGASGKDPITPTTNPVGGGEKQTLSEILKTISKVTGKS